MSSGDATGPWLRRHAADCYFWVALTSSIAVLLRFAHKLWFFGDDWDFLLRRGVLGDSEEGLFTPHNEHWSTAPILAFRALFTVFGIRHYLPYAALVVALHAAITVCMWLLLRRHGMRPWVAAAFGSVLALNGAGGENTLWDFQVGFLLPILCALLSLLLMPMSTTLARRDAVVVALLLLGLASSGQGIVAVLVVSVYALLARGVRASATLAGAGAAFYLPWYLLEGHSGLAGDDLSLESVGATPAYLWTGLANVWSATSGVPGVGLVVIVLAVASLLQEAGQGPRHLALSSACLAGAVGMFGLAGTTRAQFGVEQAMSSRYVYIATVLLTPLLAAGVQRLLARSPSGGLVAVGTCATITALVLVSSVHSLSRFEDSREDALDGIPERIVGAWQLVHDGQILLADMPDSRFTPDVTTARLRRLSPGQLPDLGANDQGRLEAGARLQVAVQDEPFALGSLLTFTGAGIPRAAGSLLSGCLQGRTTAANAYFDFPVPAGGGMVAFATSDRHFGTQLVDGARLSGVIDRPAASGEVKYVAVTAQSAVLRIILPAPASFRLCAG